jgi:hypothetical protein
MPVRRLAPLPGLIPPSKDPELRTIVDALNSHAKFLRSTVTNPRLQPPTGPVNVSVAAVGSTNTISFQADPSGPLISCYRVWRAAAGTALSPTTPGPNDSTRIGVLTANNEEDGGLYHFSDRDFTIPQMDPANPARFSYWVQSVDDRGSVSSFVPVTGSPIRTQVNGPGDQSPEQTAAVGNKLINSACINDNTAALSIRQPYAIVSSTNATPIVVNIGLHAVSVDDLVAIDNHSTNTNANGWWRVSAKTASTVTLSGSVGNGVGGATGKLYMADATAWGQFPPQQNEFPQVSASGEPGSYKRPRFSEPGTASTFKGDKYCAYLPWYSEQATLANARYSLTGFFAIPTGAAGVTNSFAQEVGTRKFAQTMSLCFSVYAYFAGVNPLPDSEMILEVLGVDVNAGTEASLFSTRWTTALGELTNAAGGGGRRFVFNFKLGSMGYDRLKFRISNKCVSGTGQALILYAPMVNMGDAASLYTSVTDPTDWGTAVNLSSSAWSRTVAQYIKRDASAPYA